MAATVLTTEAARSANIEIIENGIGTQAVHDVVTAMRANRRSGTANTKTRAEVKASSKKPWRQKGTGRARAGTIRSPIWRSGGVTFAAQPQDHSQKVNRKMYRAAMQCILAELVRQERLIVVETFELAEAKTKAMLAKLAEFGATDALIVTEAVETGLYLAARNIPKIDVVDAAGINPVSLVGSEKVIVTVAALKKIEELLG